MTMKNKILSFVLALIMLLNMLTVIPTTVFAVDDSEPSEAPKTQETEETKKTDNYIEGKVTLTCDGSEQVSLKKGDKLYAFTTLDSSIGSSAMYSWQVLTENNEWATITGYVFYYAVISNALLSNAVRSDGSAYLRCIATIGENKYVSNVLTVTPSTAGISTTITDSEIEQLEVSPTLFSLRTSDAPVVLGASNGSSANDAFQIVITYTYRHANAAPGLNIDDNRKFDGSTAANTFTVTLPDKAYYTGTVATPLEIGYLPYVTLDQASYVAGTPAESDYITYDGVEYVLANSIEFVNQTEDITINVHFIPQIVTYRVKIYEQNLYNDEYTLAETITKTGIANSAVGEGHDTPRVGYTPLYYDEKTSIDEDGSFAIDIYYDRNYYLVDFQLQDNDDAFGVVNHYVRYKSTVVLPPPTRPGYNFINWTLASVKDDQKSNEQVTSHTYPTTADGGYIIHSVEHNLVYKANWEIGKTTYTVIYWLENPDDDGFTLDSFKVVSDNVKPGDIVSAKDDLAISDKSCFEFSSKLSDKNVVVSSDGTTAVNAYYLRRYYTMTFKGTSACITKEHTHTDKCLMGNCTLENHSHTEACGNAGLICDKEEHTHVDTCCNIPEHAHTSSCCSIPYHVHGTGANSDCTKTEHPLHHDTCYSRDTLKEADSLTDTNQKTAYTTLQSKIEGPLNGYVYRIRTKRNSTIYNFLYVHNKWFYLGTNTNYNGVTASGISNPASAANSTSSAKATAICGLELHTHGDGNCTCPITEHDHTSGCTCSETRHVHGEGDCNYICGYETHVHNINCYTHLCGKTAHTHGANCVRTCQQVEHTHTTSCQTNKSQNFLTFKAKYNADISKIWPSVWAKFTNGERWKADTYFNQVLVYLPFMPPANITFTSDAGSSSKLYNINYYLEALGTTETKYQNKYFDLNNTVNAKYSYLTPDEDFFDIPGFTQFASNPAFGSNDQLSTDNGGPVSLYYERNEYDLEFVSLGTTLSTRTKTLKYQQPIDESFELLAKDVPYPSSKETGAIRFVGWYTTPTCAVGTEFTFDGKTTMPIGGLVLYAKWETCSYTYSVYSNVEKKELLVEKTVFFDSFVEEPDYIKIQHPDGLPDHEHPGYEDGYIGETEHLIFTGWYYMENGEEKRFDFNTMSIKNDMVIYAKWSSRIPVKYTVRYVYHNGTEYVDIAEPTTGASLAGITKNFVAKVTTDLYDDYRVYYFPDVRSHSMTMSSNETENVFLFVYSSIDEIKYTVTHVFTDNKIPEGKEMTVFESVLGKGNNSLNFSLSHTISGESVKQQAASVAVSFREGVTKANIAQAVKAQYGKELEDTQIETLWNVITEMSPNYYIQDLILTTNSASNNAVFTWKDIGDQALYQIIYYEESIDGSEYLVHSTQTAIVNSGTVIDVYRDNKIISIEYFEHDPNHPLTISSGTATETTFDPSTGTLSKGLVLKLYYTRKEYTYTVHHYKHGTTTSLAESTESKAKYEHTISVDSVALEIPGYTLVNGSEVVEISANDEQTIVCYYQGLEVNYQYQIIGMGATIEKPTDTVAIGGNKPTPKTLELWNEGYFLHAWYYSIGDGEKKPVPNGWLSDDKTVISLPAPGIDLAGQTVYIYAEVLPTTRRFSVEGFEAWENDPQAFVFRLQGKEGTSTKGIDLTFTIFDIGYTDVSHLPYGEYTLTTLHWAWRLGHPDTVSFNGQVLDAKSGTVTLNLNTTGDVIITYPSDYSRQWLSDDASGVVPLTIGTDR